ncbi:MAG TPA: Clp protease N-terminal domain-containing protein [Gaiellaceae bacterium]
MATLHVRNVPEPLYELLRDCAEREGRSIGAQATMLLQQALMPLAMSRGMTPGPGRRFGFQRFTESAREIVARSQDEARAVGATHVEPAHLLIAVGETEGRARTALERIGVTADGIRSQLERGPGSPKRIPFAPDTKKVLELALREALALRHTYIGGEHVLLALAPDPLLEHVGEHDVRTAVMLALAMPSDEPPPAEVGPAYHVEDLKGDDARWSTRLNELAAEGWELLQLVDRRAVLRRI